nr:hypothetical protein [uncultured Lachnoclostridium sp.]
MKAKGYQAQVIKNVNSTTNGTPSIANGEEKVVLAGVTEQE